MKHLFKKFLNLVLQGRNFDEPIGSFPVQVSFISSFMYFGFLCNDPNQINFLPSSEGEGGEQTRGGRKFVQKMQALLVDGSPDRVQCVAASGLALPGSRSSANATVTLQWGPAALLADNPDQFTSELLPLHYYYYFYERRNIIEISRIQFFQHNF